MRKPVLLSGQYNQCLSGSRKIIMPTYTLKNTKTGEIFERVMKMSEYDGFMEENPDFERYHDAPAAVIDPVTAGVLKPPSDLIGPLKVVFAILFTS